MNEGILSLIVIRFLRRFFIWPQASRNGFGQRLSVERIPFGNENHMISFRLVDEPERFDQSLWHFPFDVVREVDQGSGQRSFYLLQESMGAPQRQLIPHQAGKCSVGGRHPVQSDILFAEDAAESVTGRGAVFIPRSPQVSAQHGVGRCRTEYVERRRRGIRFLLHFVLSSNSSGSCSLARPC